MKVPSAPKQITWIIGLICGILAIVGHFVKIPFASDNCFILLGAGFVILALGTTFKDI